METLAASGHEFNTVECYTSNDEFDSGIEQETLNMRHSATLCLIFTVALSLPAWASSSRQDDVNRIEESAAVFQEIMSTPDKAIPEELLDSAQCLAIIPAEKKFAFVVGGNYGKGLVTCRTDKGWSAPLFLTVSGGSVGFQIGGSSTDLVLVFRGKRGLEKLLSNKFQIGGDATAAAGPVGRHAAAGTDIYLHAQILTYSRSRGAFAGISLNGAVVQPDDTGNVAMYGREPNQEEILIGKVAVPREATPLVVAVEKATRAAAPSRPPVAPQ
jgi:lipid-binding SYLF domain-containing protein